MTNLSINPYGSLVRSNKDMWEKMPERFYQAVPDLSSGLLLRGKQFKKQALIQKSTLLTAIPPELISSILKKLPFDSFVSFISTCQGAYQHAESYWPPLFKDNVEAASFLHASYKFAYYLRELRAMVYQHLAQEIRMPQGVHMPSVVQLLQMSPYLREEPEILVKLGLLNKEQLEKAQLGLTHKRHLLSNGAILRLVSGLSVDLKALSCIPEEYVEEGILLAIHEKEETVLTAMVQSGLFVDIPSGMACRTPLHKAAADGKIKIVRTLLEIGAQASLNLKDDNGDTPLDVAQANGHQKVAEILRRANAKISNGDSFLLKG